MRGQENWVRTSVGEEGDEGGEGCDGKTEGDDDVGDDNKGGGGDFTFFIFNLSDVIFHDNW